MESWKGRTCGPGFLWKLWARQVPIATANCLRVCQGMWENMKIGGPSCLSGFCKPNKGCPENAHPHTQLAFLALFLASISRKSTQSPPPKRGTPQETETSLSSRLEESSSGKWAKPWKTWASHARSSWHSLTRRRTVWLNMGGAGDPALRFGFALPSFGFRLSLSLTIPASLSLSCSLS